MPAPLTVRVFGQAVTVYTGGGVVDRVLRRELALYPPASGPADLTVHFDLTREAPALSANPSTHREHDDGFTIRYTMADVRYRFADGRLAGAAVAVRVPSRAWRPVQKWADMQFSSREERAGMILHEAVLVPAAALAGEVAPVHASALLGPRGAVLFGGTGGVGKTSLELDLGLGEDYAFVADDIAVLDGEGRVYPNLAFPKVYGYNARSAPPVRAALRAGRGPLDWLHWHLHAARGLDHVRRRLSPEAVYGAVAREPARVARYVLLFRERRDALVVEALDRETAVEASVDVLQTELDAFLTHLRYHRYNRRLLGLPAVAGAEAVAGRWRHTLTAALEGVRCQVARIPVGMDHEAFKAAMREALR